MRKKAPYWIAVVLIILEGCLAEQPPAPTPIPTAGPTEISASPTPTEIANPNLEPTGTTQAQTPHAAGLQPTMMPEEDSSAPPAIILFIGDGMGSGYRQAATWLGLGEGGVLAMDDMAVHGIALTASADNSVTDSAAAATAMATGLLTRNKYLGVGVEKNVLVSILELAQMEGWAVGLVTTVQLTHATPAAFAAHLPNRTDTPEIARQMMEKGIDVLLGGGEDDFHSRDEAGCFPGRGEQPAGMDLVSKAEEDEYHVVCSKDELLRIDINNTGKLLGLFSAEELPAPFSPNLVDMTGTAIEILSQDPDGFFLMVEGGQIDWAGHDNEAVAAMEFTIELDNAISLALAYAQENQETLIIVTADHDTGGMLPNRDGAGSFRQDGPFNMPDGTAFWVDWETGNHTGVSVPVTAQGPYAENLAGEFPLTKIFETMTLHLFSASQ